LHGCVSESGRSRRNQKHRHCSVMTAAHANFRMYQ
jgi:hypothetical protein